jgi:hypothetical protein
MVSPLEGPTSASDSMKAPLAERRHDLQPRERRLGASRLSKWTPRQVALVWLLWPCILAALIGIGIALSYRLNHGFTEVPFAFSRSMYFGLALTVVVVPGCLTVQWWLMRDRRHGRGSRALRAERGE